LRELPPEGLRAAIEITQIVSMPDGIVQRAEALLGPLREVVPFEGAWLSLLDPLPRQQLRQRGQQHPISRRVPRIDMAAQHRQLMAKHRDLHRIGVRRRTAPPALPAPGEQSST
jgi:hypothetical protein